MAQSAFHWVKFRAFVHATESRERVEEALRFVCGDEAEISVTKTEGFHGNPIEILESEITRKKDINGFFTRMKGAGIRLDENASEMVDEDCSWRIRLGKQAAFEERIERGANSDVIIIQAKVSAYPAKKTVAVKNLLEYASSLR